MPVPPSATADPIRLVVLDLAGTTVTDAGAVEGAFAQALHHMKVIEGSGCHARMSEHIRATMGKSKISVFRDLFADEDTVQAANHAFEEAYDRHIADGRCTAIPGARETIGELRSAGIAVVLTTGFSPRTRDGLLSALGWQDVADAVVSPADAGRGRPYPDMVLTAVLRTRTPSVQQVAVVGDTPYDVQAGLRAGAGFVAGVLTGSHDKDMLQAAGAHHVLDSVAQLPALVLGR